MICCALDRDISYNNTQFTLPTVSESSSISSPSIRVNDCAKTRVCQGMPSNFIFFQETSGRKESKEKRVSDKQRRNAMNTYSNTYCFKNCFLWRSASSGSTFPVCPSVPRGLRQSRIFGSGLFGYSSLSNFLLMRGVMLPSQTHLDSKRSPFSFRQ